MDPFLKATVIVLTWLWLLQPACGWYKASKGRRLLQRHLAWVKDVLPKTPRKRVALVVPVKGRSAHLGRFLDFVLAQNYGPYRVIFATESENDPATESIRERLAGGVIPTTLVIAGPAERSGQKVHNQLAAFSTLTDEDEIIAMADCDVDGTADWLASLVLPINLDQADCTTSNRWFLPMDQRIPNRILALTAMAIDGVIGPRWRTILWGGSMAMSRSVFEEIDVPGGIAGSFNDDAQITDLAIRANKRSRSVRAVAPLVPVRHDWPELVEFGRRQYFQIRIYRPIIWWTVLAVLSVYLAGFATCLIRLGLGDPWMLLPLTAGFGFAAARNAVRRKVIPERFDDPDVRSRFDQALQGSWWMDPLVFAVHGFLLLSTSFGRTMTWSGNRYRVEGRQSVEVLSRES